MAEHHRQPPSYLAAAAALLLVFLIAPLAAGDPLGQLCGTSGNYSTNSAYQANIQRLSATLPDNTSSSRTLFATATLGTVYALALCRGDTNAPACSDCVANACREAQQVCKYNMDVTVFYDPCLLRFSNQSFLASTNGGGGSVLILVNTENVSALFNVSVAPVGVLVNSSKRFETLNKPKIYGLVQCTPSKTPADCRSCFGNMNFRGKQVGRVLGFKCKHRYELYGLLSVPLPQLPAPSVGTTAPAPAPAPAAGGGGTTNKTGRILTIALPILAVAGILAVMVIYLYQSMRKGKPAGKPPLPDATNPEDIGRTCSLVVGLSTLRAATNPEDIESIDSLILDLSTLRAATDNFDESKKLGEGRFGAVYKGILPDDREIAVKRLSQSSRQGIEELKNELVLVAKLEHENLVRLVGVCLEEHEKLLVYEYMPNKSLDTILFDSERSNELDWGKRFNIIKGISKGLQYLHENSQLKIIHRDLKASNVLLDCEFNPKISDFGLARLFGSDQSQHATNRAVGTYGYMAPEYAVRGHYSIKSDVFSFGVLLLEMVTGRRNSGSYNSEQSVDLLSFVWEHWTMGKAVEIMDSSLSSHSPGDQMLKCIHIGLLCVQEDAAHRPMMSTVNVMLSSSNDYLPAPSRPYIKELPAISRSSPQAGQRFALNFRRDNSDMSPNEVSIIELQAR